MNTLEIIVNKNSLGTSSRHGLIRIVTFICTVLERNGKDAMNTKTIRRYNGERFVCLAREKPLVPLLAVGMRCRT